MKQQLSLIAKDGEDLAVIAACLQDALVPLSEIHFDKKERCLYMIANRFRWERATEHAEQGATIMEDALFNGEGDDDRDSRRNAAIRIDHVIAVRSRGIDLSQRDRFLSLLTLRREGEHLDLIFAGGGVIRLEIRELALVLREIGAAWPAQARTDHGLRL